MVLRNLAKAYQSYDKKIVNQVTFIPVSDGSAENKSFFLATPGGKLELSVVNDAAVASLQIGKSYYIDIVEAE